MSRYSRRPSMPGGAKPQKPASFKMRDSKNLEKESFAQKQSSQLSAGTGDRQVENHELESRYDSGDSFYGKATVKREGDKKTLYSYGTPVAEVSNGKARVMNTQSQTTVRHVKEFLKQEGFKAESKKQIEKDYS